MVTEDYYFWSHRLLVAKAAQEAGFEVFVATHINQHEERLSNKGFHVFSTRFSRSNRNLFFQLKALLELMRIFRQVKPDIVHNIALKAIVFGSIAAWVARVPRVINLVAGLGVVFTSDEKKYRLFARAGRLMAQVLLQRSNTWVVTQNSDDAREIKQMAPKANIRIIKGSGVDVSKYALKPEPGEPIRVSLVGRMLWHKGIGEFVEASKLLKSRDLAMQLVGGLDLENPAHIRESELMDWHQEGCVQWLGHREDIAYVWAQSHMAVLPSYREGLPKSLLEAAACGKPIVAADTPGCREIVIDGYNGFLVPKQNSVALAAAILKLALDPILRAQMGENSRKLVCEKFSNEIVVQQTLELYHELL